MLNNTPVASEDREIYFALLSWTKNEVLSTTLGKELEAEAREMGFRDASLRLRLRLRLARCSPTLRLMP